MDNIQFAAIDIGSNAVRMLIKSISPDENTDNASRKLLMLRVPLRLGQESFSLGKISDKKAKKLIKLMKAFKHLMNVYDVSDYRACATSAMRDAENGKALVKEIRKEVGIKIDIISGQEEASIIYESHFGDSLNQTLNHVYVDVGGGSTEVGLIVNGELIQSQSYNIGTVRLLNDKVDSHEYERLHSDLTEIKEKYSITDVVGSGGNILKLQSLAGKPKNEDLSLEELEVVYSDIKPLSVEDLINTYKMKPDRADVIVHAAEIYLDVARSVGCSNFIVPTIGLTDGIIHILFIKWKDNNLIEKNNNWT